MRLSAVGGAVVLGCLGSACSKPAPVVVPVADAGPVDAGPPPDAGPKPIPGAKLTAQTDGGFGTGDDAGEAELDLSTPDASIPDWARLTFSAEAQLQDFRARLVSSDGQLVASHSDVWVVDGGTRVDFKPADHWPGRGCCRLVVDGQLEKLPTGDGSRFQPFEVDFGVTPNPDHPVPKRAVKHRHRHR